MIENLENKNELQNLEMNISYIKRTFSYEEVQKIALDIMNLGMSLRQNQLNGYTDKSGDDLVKEYMDRL